MDQKTLLKIRSAFFTLMRSESPEIVVDLGKEGNKIREEAEKDMTERIVKVFERMIATVETYEILFGDKDEK